MIAERKQALYRKLELGLIAVLLFLTAYFGSSYFIKNGGGLPAYTTTTISQNSSLVNYTRISSEVLPQQGFVINASWGDIGKELVGAGALNLSFVANSTLGAKEPLTSGQMEILSGNSTGRIMLNSSSEVFDLYLLWALGINNKNNVINNGPIMSNGNPDAYASTGGYGPLGRLSIGNLSLISLNATQEAIVENVSARAYRPCCDNPASFPDCNHGAAQLGLIELMASQGRNESQIFAALKNFTAFYFPMQALEAAAYANVTQHETWGQLPAEEAVGYNFSSATGAQKIHQYLLGRGLLPATQTGGSSCGT